MKPLNWLKQKISPEIKYIILLFFVTRIILAMIGVSSQMMLDDWHKKENAWNYSNNKFLDLWSVWDSSYYLGIAEHGYTKNLGEDGAALGQANYAFFPLYPLLIKIVGPIVGSKHLAGLIISNIALLLASVFLYKLVQLKNDGELALRTVKYLYLFPSAFILSGVFSEGLFLALLLACFYYAEKGRWQITGILGLLLSLTRPVGILMLLPLFYQYLKTKEFKLKQIKPDIFYLLLLPLGLGIFSWYNYYLTGDFLAFVHIQKTGWAHVFSNPLIVMWQSIFTKDIFRLFNGIFLVTVFLVLNINYKKIGFTYWLLGILLITAPLLSGIVSINSILRYMLPIFPIYIVLAKMTKQKYADQFIMIALALLQGFLMVFWSNGFHLIV